MHGGKPPVAPLPCFSFLYLKQLDILEYLHGNEYVHADVKAANLLTSVSDASEVYLVDYGLAFRYLVDGKHKDYKEDPKRTHDGTVEFTSRDAHRGVGQYLIKIQDVIYAFF